MPQSDPPLKGSALRLSLLGASRWTLVPSAKPVPLTPKDAALLAKLALDGPQARLALCELIWPSSSEKKAAANLRSRAYRLHRDAKLPFIALGPDVALHPGIEVDALRLGTLDNELLLAMPALLAGIDLGDHGALDLWLVEARARVESRMAAELADRAETLESEGRLHEALVFATRIAERLPASEQAVRRVMRLCYRRGDGARAEDAYLRLRALLRDEYGRLPDAETERAYRTIVAARAPVATARQPMPLSLLRPPILVGRREPYAAMSAAWQSDAPFVLVGESGLGKTRLIEAFVQGVEGCLVHGARPGDAASPNALLGRLLLEVEQQYSPVVDRAVRNELSRAAPTLGDEPATSGQLSALRQAAECWFAAALERGLRAIVVDDAHNADTASLLMLRWLSASAALATLRIGLASHPWSPHAELGTVLNGWATDSHRLVPIALQPLSADELAELVASLALPMTIDAAVVARLHRQSGGHPLYTLATLQLAVARNVDARQPGSLASPDSVHALLDARIAALPASCRTLLQVAAVGGADLSVERAARLLDCPPLALADAWATLEGNGVLRGEKFSHDLVHAAALRTVPLGIRQALHRQWAALLGEDRTVLLARIAVHWEAGLRWSEAGGAWARAANAARTMGSLDEHSTLCLRAARCHAEAGDLTAEADALIARLEGLQLHRGGIAVLEALIEVEPRSITSEQRLRCMIARTEACLDQQRPDEAISEASAVIAAATAHSDLALEARTQRANALAQRGRADEALAEVERAAESAIRKGLPPLLRLKVCNARMYVNWSVGRLGDAIAAQRDEHTVAQALGDRVLIATAEVSLASLLAVIGDVPASHRHAREAHRLQVATGQSQGSAPVVLNQVVLGTAAAALGHYDEALIALERALELSGDDAGPALRAKVILASAGLWWAFGRPEKLRALLELLPSAAPPGMQIQAAWWLARAAELEGTSAAAAWGRFDRLLEAHPALPMVQGVVFEASYRGKPDQAIESLVAARAVCEDRGLSGTARALRWRELMRWLDRPGADATRAALACAEALDAHAETGGLSAKVYPPEALEGLARAHARAGDSARERACLTRARAWLEVARARVPPEHRHGYAHRNPVNRRLLENG